MKLKNDFSNETRGLFSFETTCWRCGRPNPELHHCLGRISSSPLNAYPLCRTCHDQHILMKSDQNIRKFLQQTIKFLCDQNNCYTFTKKDIEFYEKYKPYYQKRIKEVGEKGD